MGARGWKRAKVFRASEELPPDFVIWRRRNAWPELEQVAEVGDEILGGDDADEVGAIDDGE